MNVLGYTHAHSLDQFNLQPMELLDPTPSGRDLLVEVKAVGLNPIDYKVRTRRSGSPDSLSSWGGMPQALCVPVARMQHDSKLVTKSSTAGISRGPAPTQRGNWWMNGWWP